MGDTTAGCQMPAAASLPGSANLLGERIRPGKQLLNRGLVLRVQIRQPGEHMLQVPLRVEPVLLGRLHQAIDHRACPCADLLSRNLC